MDTKQKTTHKPKQENIEKSIWTTLLKALGGVVVLVTVIGGLLGIYEFFREYKEARIIDNNKAVISKLIDSEAKETLNRDLEKVMKIFDENATIIQVGQKQWSGKKEIKARYKSVFEELAFTGNLSHLDKKITFEGDCATVRASTTGAYKRRQIINDQWHDFSNILGEYWLLCQRQDKWKVVRFTYGTRGLFEGTRSLTE